MPKFNTDYYDLSESAKLKLKALCGGIFSSLNISPSDEPNELFVIPGFCDVHVHFREPGFSYKETIKTGSSAAKAGGFTDCFTMPNLNPVPDSLDNLKVQLDIIRRDAEMRIHPYGAITIGEKGEKLSDMEKMAPYVIAFSDDGRGVQDTGLMREAMTVARNLGKPIAAHCEVNGLLRGGYIHDGVYAKEHGHLGICSESEWREIERDIKLADETGVKFHVCHISTKESVELIREAKKSGVDITCETGPHYLIMCDRDLREDGRFKMNPPLRSEKDRDALIEGIIDGTIDMIATDHAPHSAEEKARGLEKSAFGVVGLETSFPATFTYMVRNNIITMDKLIRLMCINPRKRFGLPTDEKSMGYSVWNLDEKFTVDPANFKTMGRATPFEGMELFGKCYFTEV